MSKRHPLNTPQDVCEADLLHLQILTSLPDYTGDMVNIYVENDDGGTYIGELCDPRLLALVIQAPKLAEFIHFLHTTAVLDPDDDVEWIEFVAELNEQLGM